MTVGTVADGDEREHRLVYDTLLVPSFPERERETWPDYRAVLLAGRLRVLVVRGPDGPLGAAVLERAVAAELTLLSYLAVSAAARGTGIGTDLVTAAVAGNRDLLLAEVEDPRRHADTGFGDPARRARFYRGLGALVLDVPYVQPAVGPGQPAVPGMLLLVLADGPRPPDPETTKVPAPLVRRFVAEQAGTADVPAGGDGGALRAALSGDRTLRLRTLEEHLSGP